MQGRDEAIKQKETGEQESKPKSTTELIPREPVKVSSLEPGQSFTLRGKVYIVSAVYPFGVMVIISEPTPKRKLVEKLSPDTLVKLVE